MATYTINPIERGTENAQEILSLYGQLEQPPKLSHTALSTVLGFFTDEGMMPIVGAIPSAKEINYGSLLTTNMLLAECFNQLGLKRGAEMPRGSYIGPYVLGDLYYPRGISIWSPVLESGATAS